MKDKLFDPVRNLWVAATPEEKVRQGVLLCLIEQLGYPKGLLSVEVALSDLPHLTQTSQLPFRRADIICYAKDPLTPLLLIECKKDAISEEAIKQAIGYNHYVQAPYVAVAGKERIELVFPDRISFLPSYNQLMDQACWTNSP